MLFPMYLFFFGEKQDKEASILNFFLDHDIIPIEITINHELDDSEIQEIFENLTFQIGHAHTYELSKDEQDEINKIKKLIADKEASERDEIAKKRAQKELEEKQQKLEEWNKRVMEEKKKQFLKMEQESLPVREYLMKFVLPKVTDAFVEVTKLRPEDPIHFSANYLYQNNCESNVDQEVVDGLRSCQHAILVIKAQKINKNQ
ncbi:hypothetical protein ACKWTF_013432 [Chironomus riparius]